MISNVKIKNFAGIREFNVDFEQKYNYGKDQSEQVATDNGQTVSLVPTFLARNAAGKTSFIKALSFALSFSNEGDFVKRLTLFSKSVISKIESYIRKLDVNDVDKIHSFTYEDLASTELKSLKNDIYDEIAYVGSNEVKVEISLTQEKIVAIDLTDETFYLIIDNDRINIYDNIEKIIMKVINSGLVGSEANRFMHETILEIAKDIKFLDRTKNAAIFRDTTSMTNYHEFFIKHRTNIFIDELIEFLGFDAIDILLKKIDKNINKIEFDIESKVFNIYISDSNKPISAKNLSFGTQKVLEILAKSIPLFRSGGIMMIDEIENGLHLSLVKLIVATFEDSEINTAQAQLLLTTHNPLIAERNIVSHRNIYMSENNKFVNTKDLKVEDVKNKAYFKEMLVKQKNYFNDLFWIDNSLESKSSLSNIAIRQIISAMEEGVTWR